MEPIIYFTRSFLLIKITLSLLIQQKKNEVEEVKFKKSREYAVTGLSINQEVDSDLVAVTDTDRQEARSKLIQRLVKEKKIQTLTLDSTVRKHLKR